MSKAVRLLLPAEQEMFAAARFYEMQASGLGQDFLDKIELALRELVTTPERWPIVQDDTRRHLIRRFPYSLLYCNARFSSIYGGVLFPSPLS